MADESTNPQDDAKPAGAGGALRRITAADLLDTTDVDRPGSNRACLGILERAIKYGYIDLAPVDIPDLVQGLAKLAKSQNERVAVAARRVQGQLVVMNNKLVIEAERLAQAERLAIVKLPGEGGPPPQTVVLIEGDGATVQIASVQQPPAPEPPATPGSGVQIAD